MTIAYRDAELDCEACATVPPDEACPESCDRRFVLSSWSRSMKGAHSAGMIWHEDWSTVMHAQIGRLIADPDTRTVIAFENTDPRFTYGFIAGDTSDKLSPIVFYVFVKAPYRLAGYARGLFAELGVDPAQRFTYACKTGVITKLAYCIPRAKWNPDVARYPRKAPSGPRRFPMEGEEDGR